MREDLITILLELCKLYDKDASDALTSLWCGSLSDLTKEELSMALRMHAKGPDCRFFPMPGQLLAWIRPVPDKEEEASLIVNNIFAALRLYGTDSVGENRAQLRIGPTGWEYIKRCGGWTTWSLSIKDESDIPIMQAQARRSVMGLLEIKKSNEVQGEIRKLSDFGVKLKELRNMIENRHGAKKDWGSFPDSDKATLCQTIKKRIQGKMTDQEWECFCASLQRAADASPEPAIIVKTRENLG